MDRPDSELVQAVLGGEREAFAVLYDRYARLVSALCRAETGDSNAAADLSQEAFLRAFRRLNSLADRDRFGAWLAGIARLVCREWQKDRWQPGSLPVPALCAMDEMPASRDAVAGASLEQAERLAQLRGALAKLPERDRLALHAFYVQNLDVGQMCRLLGVTRSGLYHVLATARNRLAEKLTRQEVLP